MSTFSGRSFWVIEVLVRICWFGKNVKLVLILMTVCNKFIVVCKNNKLVTVPNFRLFFFFYENW
jgi:hypothetical protein